MRHGLREHARASIEFLPQISSLFETSKVSIDPLSPRAEYDLAAFIGTNFDADKCAERYHQCSLERSVIGTGLRKIAKKQKEKAPEKKKEAVTVMDEKEEEELLKTL